MHYVSPLIILHEQNLLLNYYFSVIYDIPVTDSTEFIRNVDMAVDYLEKYGVIDKIQNAMNKVKEFFGS